MRAYEKAWIQGFAAAMARLNRVYDQPTMCGEIIASAELTIADFEQAGADARELRELRTIERGSRAMREAAGRAALSADRGE